MRKKRCSRKTRTKRGSADRIERGYKEEKVLALERDFKGRKAREILTAFTASLSLWSRTGKNTAKRPSNHSLSHK